MANNRKAVNFETRILHEGKVFLKVSDAAKALNYHKQQDFINDYPQLIKKISGIQCINEFDYNDLLSANNEALSHQGQIEITKVETLRSNIDSMIDIKSLEITCPSNYINMMVAKTGCKSPKEYIMVHEIPEEKKKILHEFMRTNEHRNKSYHDMVEYLSDKEQFDIDIIRYHGLDVQFLTSIDGNGEMSLEAFVVGKGVFYNVTDYSDYALWNALHTNKEGDVILPWYNYNSNNPKTLLVNLSKSNINRDFSNFNVVENMLWCIENLDVKALEDYGCSVFGYKDDTIDFCMSIELLAKIIRPDTVNIVYVDKIIDAETGLYMTEFDKEKVFEKGVAKIETPIDSTVQHE